MSRVRSQEWSLPQWMKKKKVIRQEEVGPAQERDPYRQQRYESEEETTPGDERRRREMKEELDREIPKSIKRLESLEDKCRKEDNLLWTKYDSDSEIEQKPKKLSERNKVSEKVSECWRHVGQMEKDNKAKKDRRSLLDTTPIGQNQPKAFKTYYKDVIYPERPAQEISSPEDEPQTPTEVRLLPGTRPTFRDEYETPDERLHRLGGIDGARRYMKKPLRSMLTTHRNAMISSGCGTYLRYRDTSTGRFVSMRTLR